MKLLTTVTVISALIFLAAVVGAKHLQAAKPAVSPTEAQIVKYIDDHYPETLAFLEAAVNINSGTNNFAGVSAVADLIEPRLQRLGFKTWREDMKAVKRGQHLFATHQGRSNSPRFLLIGHLDTIFEPESGFLKWKNLGDGRASGPGAGDMKGGDTVLLQVLEALNAAGELSNMNITVAFTGDEETPGADPDGSMTTTRATLINMGKQTDYVLAFEPSTGNINTVKTFRRGASTWNMTVSAKSGHSSILFNKEMGPGAIYPVSKILGRFYQDLRSDKTLTFNVGHIIGGTLIARETPYSAKVMGKDNVIPAKTEIAGDLRFANPDLLRETREKMRAIVAEETTSINEEYDSAARVSSDITFADRYPAMVETSGNLALLSGFNAVSTDLGFGPVTHFTANGGAADSSFVAPYVLGVIDGLGPFTIGMHSKDEVIQLDSIKTAAKRASVFLLRLNKAARAK